MANLWRDLPRPIHALAPMEDVTDTVFRRIVASCGRPDVMFTEFIHTDIVLAPRGKRPGVTPRLVFTPQERPLVAQIWGTDPESYRRAAARLAQMGFDGIDINMGCPVRKIRRKGACAALIRNPELAAELVLAAREGAAEYAREHGEDPLPVSVKTRIGYDRPQTETWVARLLELDLDALTLHGRDAEQESEGEADWDEIGRAARIARELGVATAILGNGDVMSREQIDVLSERHRLDGAMVGRGVFADPCLFSAYGPRFDAYPPRERVELLRSHLRLYRETWGVTRNYEILKKFFKIYLTGFDGCDELRDELNATHDYDASETVLDRWFEHAAARAGTVSP